MHRLSLWLVGLFALTGQAALVRSAEPLPEAKSASPVPAADASGRPVVVELGGEGYPMYASRGRGGFVGGAGIYWLQPYFENNLAFAVATTTATGPGGTFSEATERTDVRHHMAVAPQLWLGFVGDEGLGGRVRWWYFRQGTDQSVSVPTAAPGTLVLLTSAGPQGFAAFVDNDGGPATLSTTSKLELQVWDFEVTQNLQAGNWDLLFAGGLRWVHLNQHYNAFVTGDAGGDDGGGLITATVLSGHSFHGIGPELGLEARRPLGDGGLALYSSARVALLFGSANQSAADIFTSQTGAIFIDTARDERNHLLPVGELELGLEFARTLGASRAFGQIALVGQQWWGAGSASRSSQVNTVGSDDPSAQSAIVDSDLGFIGVAFRLGVDY